MKHVDKQVRFLKIATQIMTCAGSSLSFLDVLTNGLNVIVNDQFAGVGRGSDCQEAFEFISG